MLYIPIVSTMKGLLGALELQVGDTQFESTCLEEPTFRIQTRKVWIGTRYRKQDDMAVCFCTTCMWLMSVVGESHLVSSRNDGSWKHPGPGLSLVESLIPMSESKARVYTNTSRRANRKQPADHKVVYRSVLGNPFHVDW